MASNVLSEVCHVDLSIPSAKVKQVKLFGDSAKDSRQELVRCCIFCWKIGCFVLEPLLYANPSFGMGGVGYVKLVRSVTFMTMTVMMDLKFSRS